VAAVAIVVLVIIAVLAVLAFGALNWLGINPGGGADGGTCATDQPGVLPTLPAPAPTLAPPESFGRSERERLVEGPAFLRQSRTATSDG
jgi:hypothetical protein